MYRVPFGALSLEEYHKGLYITDNEIALKSSISKFVDDTEAGRKALTTADCEAIQKDFDQIIQWSEKW